MKKFYLCLIIALFISTGLFAEWDIEDKSISSDGDAFDKFGYSVCISGDYAVIGAHYDDDGGNASGSAYIFRRTGDTWLEQAKLTASDGAADDWFGKSVSISGDYALIGATGDGYDFGAAYIFHRTGTTWTEQAKITASDGENFDLFGSSVSISGDYAVIGANGDDSNSGAAYIFQRTETTWIEQAKITASDGTASDYFGSSVSVSGDYAVIGANGDDSYSGAAYIFQRTETAWIEQTKITASDADASDEFGFSVSISGEYAVIGAGRNDDNGSESGSAYIIQKTEDTWSEQIKITASDAASYDWFGKSVSISGDYAVIGADGDDDNGSRSGSAYIFKKTEDTWSEQTKITASDGVSTDYFGFSVSISGDYAVIGAYQDDDNGYDSGSAYFYYRNPLIVTITIAGNHVELTWNDVNAAGYNVYRSTDPYTEDWGNAIGSSDTNSYTDYGAATETKYFYYVTTVN